MKWAPEDRKMPGDRLVDAAHFAAVAHKFQRRKGDGGAYVEHPLSVARRLSEAGVEDERMLIAAMLHDTVEDTDVTLAQIEARYGGEVASIVAEVTDDKALGKADRKRQQVEHARTISRQARMVKLADKLDNLSAMFAVPPAGWSPSRIQGYFLWALTVVNAGLRGVLPSLEAELDALLTKSITLSDQTFPVLPPGDHSALLLEYYHQMDGAKD